MDTKGRKRRAGAVEMLRKLERERERDRVSLLDQNLLFDLTRSIPFHRKPTSSHLLLLLLLLLRLLFLLGNTYSHIPTATTPSLELANVKDTARVVCIYIKIISSTVLNFGDFFQSGREEGRGKF